MPEPSNANARYRNPSGPKPKHDCFAVCTPGLERLVDAELRSLGLKPGRRERGGVAFVASSRQLYAVNLWSRLSNRVLVRLGTFHAPTFKDLRREISALRWENSLGPRSEVQLRITSGTGSKLYHTGAVAERVAESLGTIVNATVVDAASIGHDPLVVPPQLVVIRIVNDRATVSVDSSGEHLHRRGWRLDGAKAPLRETLAAAMLAATGWSDDCALIDPFCGSGTIAIEAAQLGRDLPPGEQRTFAFSEWPSFEPGSWASVIGEAATRTRDELRSPIIATDRDDGAVAAARANAERAGVADDIEIRSAAVSDMSAPADSDGPIRPGWVITNPPYGNRVGGVDLRNLYGRFGAVTKSALPGWRVALLVADTHLAAHTTLSTRSVLETTNGGTPVSLLVSDG